MDKSQLIAAAAEWMKSQTPDQRLDFLSTLRTLTNFCWHCGGDFDDHRRLCYCRRDD